MAAISKYIFHYLSIYFYTFFCVFLFVPKNTLPKLPKLNAKIQDIG